MFGLCGTFKITSWKGKSTCKYVQPAVKFLKWNRKVSAHHIRGSMCTDIE